MNVVLYSTGCPQCNVLKKKLDDAGVQYEVENDVEVMLAKGFSAAPMLEVDGEVMAFRDANAWVNKLGD